MKTNDPDYLWQPAAQPEPEVSALERQLSAFSARARGLDQRPTPQPRTRPAERPRRRFALWALAAAALALLASVPALNRWSWPAQAAWPLQLTDASHTHSLQLAPGQTLQLAADEAARIDVARIGQIALQPGSSLQLIETAGGQHRVALRSGRMQVRVWAPPGHFGVFAGGALVLDLGCVFELAINTNGHGSLQVSSGWVMFERAGRETLVPEHHAIDFDRQQNSTPLRLDAGPPLAAALAALDRALYSDAAARGTDVQRLAAALAAVTGEADKHTLLSLLSRYPPLAKTALYPQLARALGVAGTDAQHRIAWAAGDHAAIEAWWKRVPKPPKAWWRNWRDAF